MSAIYVAKALHMAWNDRDWLCDRFHEAAEGSEDRRRYRRLLGYTHREIQQLRRNAHKYRKG